MTPSSTCDGPGLAALSNHALLEAIVADQQQANLAEAAKLAKMAEFRRRLQTDFQARRAEEPHFTMTPLRETTVEIAPLLGMSDGRIAADLRTIESLRTTFPGVARLLELGQLDLYRARMISDTATTHLEDPAALATLAAQMTDWLQRHLAGRATPDLPEPLVAKTPKQISNRLNYLIKKLKPADAERRFRRAFADRGADLSTAGDGMGYLTLNHDVVSLQAIDYRLTLLAKGLRRQGDARTLKQLRADLTVDLLLGRLTVGASTGELEHPETSPTGDPADTIQEWPTQLWARPVINVTAPFQTVAGLADDPGVLSGGETIPASLVRRLAQDPDSTWYRMLTDPARGCVELSTHAYRPSREIWRQVVADHNSCVAPTCTRPATGCEIDHRVPWPTGSTSTENTAPVCHPHHQAKHAPGFGLARTPEGRLELHTRAGFSHPVDRTTQPTAEGWGPVGLLEIQPTAAEMYDALTYLAHQRHVMENAAALRYEEEQLHADYRASYPQIDDETIHAWIHDDDPAAPSPPPIMAHGTTLTAVRLHEQADHHRSELAAAH